MQDVRLDLFRRNRVTFRHPRRGFHEVMAAAGAEAGAGGIDSIDLLVAALDTPRAARVVARLGRDPVAVRAAALQARSTRESIPGLTDDAKRVVEATFQRALLARSDPDVADLLVGLAVAVCQARQVLNAQGIDADQLIREVGGRQTE